MSECKLIPKVVQRRANKGASIQSSDDTHTRIQISAKDFILSQTTIISSVALEEESHMIIPSTSMYVNSNGDCWSNESCKANYKSFIGSYNYINHHQDPEHSVGFIADTLLRRINVDAKNNTFVYYVDILIATHRDYNEVVSKLLSNKIRYLSMGCESESSQCSKCGVVLTNPEDSCDCLDGSKGKYFIDKSGKRRIVAEVLGTKRSGSCEFIEASWLTEVPAFKGAAKRNHLALGDDLDIEVDIPTKYVNKDAIQRFLT